MRLDRGGKWKSSYWQMTPGFVGKEWIIEMPPMSEELRYANMRIAILKDCIEKEFGIPGFFINQQRNSANEFKRSKEI